jgi:hypothetical protein
MNAKLNGSKELGIMNEIENLADFWKVRSKK